MLDIEITEKSINKKIKLKSLVAYTVGGSVNWNNDFGRQFDITSRDVHACTYIL